MKQLVIVDSESLSEKYLSKQKLLLSSIAIALFTIFIGFTIGSLTNHPNTIEKIIYSDNYLVKQYNEPFSEKALNNLLLKLNVTPTLLSLAVLTLYRIQFCLCGLLHLLSCLRFFRGHHMVFLPSLLS